VALSTSEKALAILLGIDEALLKGKGVAARAARASFRLTVKGIAAGARYAAPAAPAVGRGLLGAARLYPGTAIAAGLGTGALAAHQLGYLDPVYETIERERQMAAASYALAAPTIIPELKETYIAPIKRKVSKANKAVKQAMTWLKAGTKAATGARPGILPAAAFRTSVMAAGMANPKTKSKPGKGKSIMNKLARRLKKWW